MISDLWQDLSFGARTLRRHPGFAAVAVLTLALGIGVNAAIFSIVDGVLLRPLPYPQADRLVRIWSASPATGQRFLATSYQDFEQFERRSDVFSALAAFSEAPRILRGARREPKSITVARVSENFFSVLGISPVHGRGLLAEEFAQGERSVILSHRLWQSRYGADPGILGQTVTIDDEPHTIVGVMPRGFDYPRAADLWRPLTNSEKQDDDPELSIIGRLAPAATVERAGTEVGAIAQQVSRSRPAPARRAAWAQTMQAMVVRDVRAPLLVLLGAVTLVLLIACANVASLLLARGLAREPEIAIRSALGARRGRIVRQLLTESALLATLGAGVGLVLGSWVLKAFVLLAPDQIPRLDEVALDGRVILVMAAVTALAGILFGVVPALQATRLDVIEAFKRGGRGAGGHPEKHRLRQGLVVAEIALATVLVVSAGLLIESFARLVSFDHGFKAENVLVVPITMRGQVDPRFPSFYEQALEDVRALPAVESAALALRTPMEAQGLKLPFRIEGQPVASERDLPQILIRPITSDYFKTVRIPVLSGRAFTDGDRAGAPMVAIVNQSFAKAFFPQATPIGRRMHSEALKESGIEIVGVVADVQPEPGEASRPAIYFPFGQVPVPGMSLLVRTKGHPLDQAPTIRARIWALDPSVPLDKTYLLEDKVAEATTSPRFTMLLVGLFAVLGLALAAIGIYGVMSYAVTERTREIGIRRALGADEAGIVRMILRQGVKLTAIGMSSGIIMAVWTAGLFRALLFRVSATDPLTLAGVASLLMAVALVACYIPARRATRIDPLVALRYE
jgi:putative ABC transport system permease protein